MIPKVKEKAKEDIVEFFLVQEEDLVRLDAIGLDGEVWNILEICGEGIDYYSDIGKDSGIPIDKNGCIKIYKEKK